MQMADGILGWKKSFAQWLSKPKQAQWWSAPAPTSSDRKCSQQPWSLWKRSGSRVGGCWGLGGRLYSWPLHTGDKEVCPGPRAQVCHWNEWRHKAHLAEDRALQFYLLFQQGRRRQRFRDWTIQPLYLLVKTLLLWCSDLSPLSLLTKDRKLVKGVMLPYIVWLDINFCTILF